MRKSVLPEGMCGNILCHLGMYQGQKDYRTYYPLEVTDVCYQDASQDGLWYPCRKPGDMIHRGEKLGEVRDYQGNIKEISIGGVRRCDPLSDGKSSG